MPKDFWKGCQSSRGGVNPKHRFFEELNGIQENFVLKNGDARRPLPLPPPNLYFPSISINPVELKKFRFVPQAFRSCRLSHTCIDYYVKKQKCLQVWHHVGLFVT